MPVEAYVVHKSWPVVHGRFSWHSPLSRVNPHFLLFYIVAHTSTGIEPHAFGDTVEVYIKASNKMATK